MQRSNFETSLLSTSHNQRYNSWPVAGAALLGVSVLLGGCSTGSKPPTPDATISSSATPSAESGQPVDLGDGGASAEPTVSDGPRTTTPKDCQPGVPNDSGLYCEIQQYGADVFANYSNASGKLAHLSVGQVVYVECRVPKQTIESSKGGWYRFATADLPEGEQMVGQYGFAVANTFENGDQAGEPINRRYDPQIPECGVEK